MIRCKQVLGLMVAVCSAFSGDSTFGGARSGGAQTTGPLDACALMLKADVDAAFAPRVFGNGEKGRGNIAGTAKLATVSGCTFTSRGASLKEMMTIRIVARRAPSDQAGITVASAKEGAVKLNTTPVDVPGLGDAAYWVNLGSSARPIVELNVFTGKRLWIIVGATAPQLGTDAALAGLTKVAKAALGRL